MLFAFLTAQGKPFRKWCDLHGSRMTIFSHLSCWFVWKVEKHMEIWEMHGKLWGKIWDTYEKHMGNYGNSNIDWPLVEYMRKHDMFMFTQHVAIWMSPCLDTAKSSCWFSVCIYIYIFHITSHYISHDGPWYPIKYDINPHFADESAHENPKALLLKAHILGAASYFVNGLHPQSSKEV